MSALYIDTDGNEATRRRALARLFAVRLDLPMPEPELDPSTLPPPPPVDPEEEELEDLQP